MSPARTYPPTAAPMPLLDRYLVSNCSPILPGPVHVVEKESQPLDASHWAKPNEKPPVVPPPDSGQVSTAVLAEGYLAFSTVYDENNYAFIHQPGTNAWTTVIVMNGKYKTVPSMVASVHGGTSDTGFITSLDLNRGQCGCGAPSEPRKTTRPGGRSR